MLRQLREPFSGRPGPGARMVAAVLVAALVLVAAPVVFPLLRWVLGLL